jgi:hypothetical protein
MLYIAYVLAMLCLVLAVPCCSGKTGVSQATAEGSAPDTGTEPRTGREITHINQVWPPSAGDIYVISSTDDDGTEAGGTWYTDGLRPGINLTGEDPGGDRYLTALRFRLPDLEAGREIAYARLRIAGRSGYRPESMTLLISGLATDGAAPFSSEYLPSERPTTASSTSWTLHHPMKMGAMDVPVYFTTPDIAPIINEILSLPGWGEAGKVLALTIRRSPEDIAGANYLNLFDRSVESIEMSPAVLEICPTIEDTFIAGPMLGRPTDRSVTINLMSLLDIDVYAEIGAEPGQYTGASEPMLRCKAHKGIDLVIDGLDPGTLYHYRLRYRPSGEGDYADGFEGSFRTARLPGETFVFTIQADSHIVGAIKQNNPPKFELYDITLRNLLADRPDFHIDLGDFAHIEHYGGASAHMYLDALDRYLVQRRCLADISGSIPFFLVVGNHEGEQGWRIPADADSLEIWGTLARKEVIPNPRPDGFYAGGSDLTACCGLRESYYAWEWGDALFVVLDPFWYTTNMPHSSGRYFSSDNAWDWTLGKEQYDWLYETLNRSGARWKFVLTHHVTGGVLAGHKDRKPYGRGGIAAASFEVDGRPTFEWGGEDSTGNHVFDTMRPDFEHGPVHKVMVDAGVDVFFHGHDHVFVYETLDGIVYQECPVPSNPRYGDGFYSPEYYKGVKVSNSGHLRVTVSPDSARVDYVRSVLPADEPVVQGGVSIRNADISYSYTLHK